MSDPPPTAPPSSAADPPPAAEPLIPVELRRRRLRAAGRAATRDEAGARMGPVTFRRLEVASFCHSLVYTGLLVCAFALHSPQPETFWLGLAHGVLWIVMSLTCIAAAKVRVIPFWLAVTVAVLGGLGPFAGTFGFVLRERNRRRDALESNGNA